MALLAGPVTKLLAALPRLTSGTPDLTRALTLVKTALDPILKCPIVRGQLITGIVIAGPVAVVPHNLGRAWTGYITVSYESTTTGAAGVLQVLGAVDGTTAYNTARLIKFQGSANGIYAIWLF